jgi:CPA2 family monovalent cation:H+ antiporter-2
MALTPLVSGQTARLYSLFRKRFRHEPLETINLPAKGLEGHVVVAGGGRVGSQVGTIMRRAGLTCVIIELDHRLVEHARRAGSAVIYGDAGHELVLEAARIGSARLLVVTTPDVITARSIITNARRLNRKIDVVARTSDTGFLEAFSEMGVTDVVLPEFETGLEMSRQALVHLGVPAPEIQRQTESLRSDLFAPFLGPAEKYRTLSQLRSAEGQLDLRWVSVPAESPLADRTIGEARIRETTGASVVGVLREGRLQANPDPDFRFRAGDLAAAIGTEAALQAFGQLAAPEQPPGSHTAL